jgi:hypothetical protein
VKIQEPVCRLLSLSNTDLAKKVSTPSIGQSQNTADSYTPGADLGYIEKEVLQVLKTIISDFKNTIDRLFKDDQYVVLPDVQTQLPGKSETPDAEHAILMLFFSGKGEAPEDPTKPMVTPRPVTTPSEQTHTIAQEPESIYAYHVSGKGIDSQYLSLLPLRDGRESEIFKKLLIFVFGIPSDPKQTKGTRKKIR